jgi:hypothetical protein
MSNERTHPFYNYIDSVKGYESASWDGEKVLIELRFDGGTGTHSEIQDSDSWEYQLPNDLQIVREEVMECVLCAARKHMFEPMEINVNMASQTFSFTIKPEWIEGVEHDQDFDRVRKLVLEQENIEDKPERPDLSVAVPSWIPYDGHVAISDLLEMGASKGTKVEKKNLKSRLKERGWTDIRIDDIINYLEEEDQIKIEGEMITLGPSLSPK